MSMLSVWFYTILSVTAVSLVSLIGVFVLPVKEKKLQSFLIYFVSFSVGALLGDVFIHLLPEIIKRAGFTSQISLYILIGIVATFVIEKILHIRHVHHSKSESNSHPMPITFMILFGDGVHNFIDGLVIGASYFISIPTGLASTIAIVLHEIPQEIGNFGVLVHGGYTKNKALLFNFLSALTALAGAIVALIMGRQTEMSVTFLSAFAAGNFIYIAASDLIPELNKETRAEKSILQFITLLFGIGVMYALLLL